MWLGFDSPLTAGTPTSAKKHYLVDAMSPDPADEEANTARARGLAAA